MSKRPLITLEKVLKRVMNCGEESSMFLIHSSGSIS